MTEGIESKVMGGHLLVECLIRQGVTHVFGVPGESFLAVLDGFYQHKNKIQSFEEMLNALKNIASKTMKIFPNK